MTAAARALIAWFERGHRDLPWRRTADPYRIWVSEIMLQQTRAQTVIPYYERFLERFPTVEALAGAAEEDVLAQWSGLGYYSRARNLQRAAKLIVAAGAFPRDYEAIRALPGVGGYTAAAVASIAFGLPHAVADGNVLRVVARMENDSSDIGAKATRDRFQATAQRWLPARRAGVFNQALMELGATVCPPRNPQCLLCPLAHLCAARHAGTAGELPVKLRRAGPKQVAATVYIVRRGGKLLLHRRADTARRMAGFWELPGPDALPAAIPGESAGTVRHTITHHRYRIAVVTAGLPAMWKRPDGYRWVGNEELGKLPVDTIGRKALGAEKEKVKSQK